MSLITNSQMNSSWSVFDAKRERYIARSLSARSAICRSRWPTLGRYAARRRDGWSGSSSVRGPFVGVRHQTPVDARNNRAPRLLRLLLSGAMVGALATRVEHLRSSRASFNPASWLSWGVFFSVGILAWPRAKVVTSSTRSSTPSMRPAPTSTLGVSDLNPYPTLGWSALSPPSASWSGWP